MFNIQNHTRQYCQIFFDRVELRSSGHLLAQYFAVIIKI